MNKHHRNQLKAELNLLDAHEIKPNYAELARKYECDYRTVKRYHMGYQGKPKTRDKKSKLLPFIDEIKQKALIPRITYKAIYQYLISKYGIDAIGSESNFKAFCKKEEITLHKRLNGTTRFETDAGDMAQADWKESIIITNRKGEKFEVNIFHLVLKYSRYSYLELTISKEQPVLFRCFINAFKYFGGIPKRILFDNMSTVVDVNAKPKRINAKFNQFAKDFNFEVQVCKPRHPFTKGTNEARNKILDWLRAYDNEFETLEELGNIVEQINTAMNVSVCQGIGTSPCIAYMNEKEYLTPLTNNSLIDHYLSPRKVRVSNEQLVYYEGTKYSVDKSYVNKNVYVEKFNDKLQIYYNGKLIQVHNVSTQLVVYTEAHYRQSMENKFTNDKFEERIMDNLNRFDSVFNKTSTITKEQACSSQKAMIAYLCSQGSVSNWIKAFISTLDNKQLEQLNEELKKTLPYVTDIDYFFSIFKYCAVKHHLDKFRFNYLIEEMVCGTSFMDKHWYHVTCDEFRDEINEHFEQLYKQKG